MRAYSTISILLAALATKVYAGGDCKVDICANNGGCTTMTVNFGQKSDLPPAYYNNLRHIKVTAGEMEALSTDGGAGPNLSKETCWMVRPVEGLVPFVSVYGVTGAKCAFEINTLYYIHTAA
ncbi:hypothetical protein V494_04284 [Pseudogymnoascus sp. VKM F-4513 (FW-928)]|nr:hypothetical protein V494_04284 [Pseudogymnoascus sp. VKM F-4513 (FW-928)]